MKDDWLYVVKRQGKPEFVKAFKRFDPARVEWTTNVDDAAEFTETEWRREGAMDFILSERLCLVSYADEPRKPGERPRRQHGKARRLRPGETVDEMHKRRIAARQADKPDRGENLEK